MDWDKLLIFHAVADAGSFTHAGETLNLSQSAVTSDCLRTKSRSSAFTATLGPILTEQGEDSI